MAEESNHPKDPVLFKVHEFWDRLIQEKNLQRDMAKTQALSAVKSSGESRANYEAWCLKYEYAAELIEGIMRRINDFIVYEKKTS